MQVFQIVLFLFLIVLCNFSELFQKSAQFNYNFYVLQFNYVYYMDFVGIARPCNYRSSSWSGDYKYFVFCHTQKIHAIVAIDKDKEDVIDKKGEAK